MSWTTHVQAAQEWDGTYSADLIKQATTAMTHRSSGEGLVLSGHRYELGQRLQIRLDGCKLQYQVSRRDHNPFRRLLRQYQLGRQVIRLLVARELWEYEISMWWLRKHPDNPDGMH